MKKQKKKVRLLKWLLKLLCLWKVRSMKTKWWMNKMKFKWVKIRDIQTKLTKILKKIKKCLKLKIMTIYWNRSNKETKIMHRKSLILWAQGLESLSIDQGMRLKELNNQLIKKKRSRLWRRKMKKMKKQKMKILMKSISQCKMKLK